MRSCNYQTAAEIISVVQPEFSWNNLHMTWCRLQLGTTVHCTSLSSKVVKGIRSWHYLVLIRNHEEPCCQNISCLVPKNWKVQNLMKQFFFSTICDAFQNRLTTHRLKSAALKPSSQYHTRAYVASKQLRFSWISSPTPKNKLKCALLNFYTRFT